jgi:ABC-type multidrug transport system fused ATPase/permease subunit
MKEFLQVLRRFIPPYKKYLVLSIVFNILSAVLNIFSFAAIIPLLQILFKTEGAVRATVLMPWSLSKKVLTNNMNYLVEEMVKYFWLFFYFTDHRPGPGLYDFSEDLFLFSFFGQYYPYPYGCGPGYS